MRLRRPINILLLLLALIAAALSPAALLAQAQIEGTVTNGTSNRPAAKQEVKLLLPRGGMQQVGTVPTDASGHFAFEQGTIDAKSFYLLSTVYQGVTYNEPVKFDSNGRAQVDVKIYDSMRRAEKVSIPEFRALVAAEGDKARVQEDYEIANTSQPPRAYTNDSGTLAFRIPAAAGQLGVSVQGLLNMPIPQTPQPGQAPGEFFIRYPLKPGVTLVTVQYELAYSPSGFEIKDRPPYPVGRAGLYVYPASLSVEAPLFKPAGQDSANNVQKLEAAAVPPGATLEARFSGESGPVPAGSTSDQGQGQQPGQQVEILPDSASRLRLPIAAAFLLLLLWALGVRFAKEWPRWKQRGAGPAQKKFGAKVETLLNSIADLDELFAAGKVPERNYWKERLELKARLVAILKKSPPALLESYAARPSPR
ncbi:MAG TPA: hypothetical protein VGW33_08775 [Terriglobia bacterium]|nr:hypothetical protein [Terriglobia bacterium]